MSKFVSTRNKGFAMIFDNLFTISVQYGTGNYCEKKNLGADIDMEMKTNRWESNSAEIAVFWNNGIMIPISSDGVDDVIGWLGTEDVAKAIAIVSSAKSADEIQTKIKKLGL